ncbi:MAG: helix-turn-helix transcriptional regulator [Clostridiales bacterium]|nr:helix-turn-helix transcriptional regulator [Clostridiales bacterium]
MAISYKKLWKLLIDKDMKKKDLEAVSGVSHYTINKLNRGENVNVDIIARICTALGCEPNDIMEIIPGIQAGEQK